MTSSSGAGQPRRIEVAKHANDDCRIVLLIDLVSELGRARQALRVPAYVFAREVDARVRAVEPEDVVILLEQGAELLVEAGVRPMPAAAELAHDLPDQPWTAI